MNLLDVDMGKQLKAASASGARYGVIVAPDELARGEVNFKDLQSREQRTVPLADLAAALKGHI
jgi:histidyl-tRNA synthetase